MAKKDDAQQGPPGDTSGTFGEEFREGMGDRGPLDELQGHDPAAEDEVLDTPVQADDAGDTSGTAAKPAETKSEPTVVKVDKPAK